MKLHILLDYQQVISTTENDLVLVSSSSSHIKGGGKRVLVNYSLINESVDLYNGINAWFDSFGGYNNIRNSAYNAFFYYIFAIIYTIDNLLARYPMEEIVLYGGSQHVYLAAMEAEGEGGKKNYKTNWLVNGIIWKQYSGKCKIVWRNKKPSFVFFTHHLFRYYFCLLKTFVHALKLKEPSKNVCDDASRQVTNKDKCYAAIVELPLQYNHIKSLFESNDVKRFNIFTTSRTLAATFCDAVYVSKLSLWKIIRVFINRKVRNSGNALPILGVKVYFLSKELSLLNFQYKLRSQRQIDYFKGKYNDRDITLVTDMTFGMDIVSCHELAKTYNWFHVNVQWVAMARVLYPMLEFADKYYLYSMGTYQLYRQYSDSFVYYLPTNRSSKNIGLKELVLTIFMQPDRFVYDYFDYLNKLLPAIEKQDLPVHLIVKPHYRQNLMEQLIEIVSPYDFVTVAGKGDSCENLLGKTSLAMSIHSSVIFEALMDDVPCLVFNPDGKYNDTIYNNDICFPEVNFVINEPEETLSYLENYSETSKVFNERRQHFINKHGGETSIKELL